MHLRQRTPQTAISQHEIQQHSSLQTHIHKHTYIHLYKNLYLHIQYTHINIYMHPHTKCHCYCLDNNLTIVPHVANSSWLSNRLLYMFANWTILHLQDIHTDTYTQLLNILCVRNSPSSWLVVASLFQVICRR